MNFFEYPAEIASLDEDAFAKRAFRVLSRTFRGAHHIPGINDRKPRKRGRLDWANPHWIECMVLGELATCDGDALTRLVVAAHDECVRVSVAGAANRRTRILLHPRSRYGERHPTMEDATEAVRRATGRTTKMLRRLIRHQGPVAVVVPHHCFDNELRMAVQNLGGDPALFRFVTPDEIDRGLLRGIDLADYEWDHETIRHTRTQA